MDPFTLIRQLQGALNGRSFRAGSSSVTITNTSDAVSAAVNHGLPAAPSQVVATARTTADTRGDWIVTVTSITATQITFRVRAGEGADFGVANPTTVDFDWFAVS